MAGQNNAKDSFWLYPYVDMHSRYKVFCPAIKTNITVNSSDYKKKEFPSNSNRSVPSTIE